MNINDIEKRLKDAFDEATEFYVPKMYQEQFRQNAFIAGGCIHALANDKEPSFYNFFLSDLKLVTEMMEEFKSMKDICNVTRDSIASFCDGKYRFILNSAASPEDTVGQSRFIHNMFYYQDGKVSGPISKCYLKTNHIIFNSGVIS